MKEGIDGIYKTYFQDIYRFLLSLCHDPYLAEDLVQETFFRAYLYLERYDGDNVKTWLFTVAHHAFIDHYRKHKRMVIKEQSFFLKMFDQKNPPIDRIVVQEEIQEIINRIENLPEKHKMAVLLRDFHGFSYREAAQTMNVGHAHFKVLLFRGRQALRNRKAGEK